MQKRHRRAFALAAALATATMLAGCNPTYNWRDYASADASYHITFPAKPVTHTRSVNLDGLEVDMTMTAAEVEGVTFAVGTGTAPDPARAQAAVAAMQTALVRNIGARPGQEDPAASGRAAQRDIEVVGTARGRPMKLRGHFEARGNRFYQVIVVGPEKALTAEHTDQFISSFKLP